MPARLQQLLLLALCMQQLVSAAQQESSWKHAATTAAAAAAAPPHTPPVRHIVSDLSAALVEELQQHNVTALLVLGQHANKAQLDYERLGQAVTLVKAASAAELEQAWASTLHAACGARQHSRRQHQRHHHPHHPAAASSSSSSSSSSGSSSSPRRWLHPGAWPAGAVAVLSIAPLGVVEVPDLRLALSAAAKLQRCLALSGGYSSHADKGDSLVVFDAYGAPLSAYFLSTNVFRDTFSRIYQQQIWSAAGGGSGEGSTLEFTAAIRESLLGILSNPAFNIQSMLDSSCGSLHWMPLVLKNITASKPGFRFHGTDVACSLIEKHRKTFAAEKAWQFDCVDYANQPLPRGYDLVWSRDSLQHVPMHAAWMFLNNVKASGARYLLVGSYLQSTEPNKDIPAGEYYPIDLTKAPFNLRPQPVTIIDERSFDGKHMLLYDVAAMTWDDELAGLI